jgi:hypothetical protein
LVASRIGAADGEVVSLDEDIRTEVDPVPGRACRATAGRRSIRRAAQKTEKEAATACGVPASMSDFPLQRLKCDQSFAPRQAASTSQ